MAPPQCEPLCHFNDRLYFTTFPHPAPSPQLLNSPSQAKNPPPRIRPRSNHVSNPPSSSFSSSTSSAAAMEQDEGALYYYFTIDNQLLYLSFFKDWGPLNLAMVYKACILIHELLEDEELRPYRLVLYASNDPRRKANAALLMALYVMIVQKKAPWEAFQPIAELEFMPFRDAGRGLSDFNLSIQDCLWGMWKAMQNGLCDMNQFDVEDYEHFEKVENGDWNWLSPNFIAFASPVEHGWATKSASGGVGSSPSPASSLATTRKLPISFQNCLDYFEGRGVKLVVRLNNMLYNKQHFLDRGIRHEELYFDDGTNPTDEIVRKFINMADEVVESGGAIAVHCKAGLGRTGTLIGAYMIWKYGFTAHEAIAFMRIVRPGSVVGPQQQYMYVKQMEWVKWAAVDEMRRAEAQAAAAIAAASVITPATPPAETDEENGMDLSEGGPGAAGLVVPSTPKAKGIPPVTPNKHVSTATARARAIEPPGQPRKTPLAKAKRTAADSVDEDSDEDELGAAALAEADESPSEEDEISALPSEKGKGVRKDVMMNSMPASTSTGSTASRARSRTQPGGLPLRGTTVAGRRPGGVTASEQRPARVTRSVAHASANTASSSRRAGTTSTRTGGPSTSHSTSNSTSAIPPSPTKAHTNAHGPSPNKIPRIAHVPASPPARSTTSMGTRSRLGTGGAGGVGATPSRLPTLAQTGRRANTTTNAAGTKGGAVLLSPGPVTRAKVANANASSSGKGKDGKAEDADAWCKTNSSGVVERGKKGERPGLRSVRRRRSSFSAADVVA